jgi:DNA repair exonuclease SbcCD nuclease subunit
LPFLVPGNHERSRIPYQLLASHPNIHIFDKPRSFLVKRNGFTLSLSGFPYVRTDVRRQFSRILGQTGWRATKADAKLLCIHHCVEGATVSGHTFRNGHDVIRMADIPKGLTAVLSGHIHRAQLLTKDLQGRPVAAPVLYPGSIERTSFAERGEKKGYLTLVLESGSRRGTERRFRFHELPTRPMVKIEIQASELNGRDFSLWLQKRLRELPDDAVVSLKLRGQLQGKWVHAISARSLRALAPQGMNISLHHSSKRC